ncbi:MAG: UDP-N-acetylmuramate dehydrogenase [Oscillospiraceae bacterium]
MNYSILEKLFAESGIDYEQNANLAALSSMKVGGKCDILIKPRSEKALQSAVVVCTRESIPYFVLGKGSNVLFGDFHGAVILTGGLNSVSVTGNTVTAGAGASLGVVCRAALEHSLSGMECLFGIPGSMGGALYMNAGAYGAEMKDIVKSARVLLENGEVVEIPLCEMDLGYRRSAFQGRNICILSVTMELTEGDSAQIKAKMEDVTQRRRDKQPLEYPSCGSTFKRPEGYFAAALIDECGLKGCTIGGAQVSEKHSGFVINKGGATLEDIKSLVEHIKRVVSEKKGVELECEMLIIER